MLRSENEGALSGDIDFYTGFLIRRAQQRHIYLWQRIVSGEISSPQFGVMSNLQTNPGLSQVDLCVALDLDRSTIADMVRRLVGKRLIERLFDPSDKRKYRLFLSDLGKSEFKRLEPKVRELDKVLTGNLSHRDNVELSRLLKLVLEA